MIGYTFGIDFEGATKMTAKVEDLTQEMPRRMPTKLDDIQTEMRLLFTGSETGLAAIEQRLGAFRAANATRREARSAAAPNFLC